MTEKVEHDWAVAKSGTVFCKNCGRVRQADGSTDKKPCKIVKIGLRDVRFDCDTVLIQTSPNQIELRNPSYPDTKEEQ